jgi:hypothetical protein
MDIFKLYLLECAVIPSSFKDNSQIAIELTLMTSFYLSYKCSIWRYYGLELQHMSGGQGAQLSRAILQGLICGF